MRGLPGYGFSCSGVLLIGIFQGLCVWADHIETLYRATGSSLNLPVNYPGKLSVVAWKFKEQSFAEYTPSDTNKYTFPGNHFSGRVKGEQNKIEVTVQDLQPKDSGTFSIIIDGQEPQPVIKTYQIYIQNPITDVQIEKTQTWKESTNSCLIELKCEAAEAEYYRWSGYKNETGHHLEVILLPVNGAVTVTCNATNNVSTESATKILTCYSEETKNDTGVGNTQSLVWIAVGGGGGAALLLIAVITAIVFRKCRKEPVPDNEMTVYADVNPGATAQKATRSVSVTNGSVYETVDDIRISPEKTIYATVMLPKHQATTSSSYEQAS